MEYYIYLIENKITSKKYIGYTKLPVKKRWKQHSSRALNTCINTPFYNAIRKYGTSSWSIDILQVENSAERAKNSEIYFIEKYNTFYEGYNATKGGDGNNGIIMSKESNLKRSASLKGITKNYDRMKGKKHNPETLEKMRKPKKDKSSYQTESFKEKMRKVQLQYAKSKRALSRQSHTQMKSMIEGGFSLKQISHVLQVSYDVVRKWCKREWED